jgi:PAS domain S-box-containing protein
LQDIPQGECAQPSAERPHKSLSFQQPFSAAAPLHTGHMATDQDLIGLRRQARGLADYFGLDSQTTSRFAAAVYEAARMLFASRGAADASVSIGPARELQVVITVDRAEAVDLASSLAAPLEALRSSVGRVAVAQTTGTFSVLLSTPRLSPAEPSADGAAESVDETAGAEPDSAARGARVDETLAEENARLRHSLSLLQAEMQETNRGVVALYAEVDDQSEQLRQAEERMRVLLDSVHDYAIIMLGTTGEIVSWNAGAERVFGYPAEEIVGRNAACFYTGAERDAELPLEHLCIASTEGRLECECVRERRAGHTFDALVLLTPMRRPDGSPRGFSMVVRDITQRKRLEDDLRKRADQLAAANRAKEDFLATLSHELRTPLNAMLGWTRLLRLGKLDPAATLRALDTIERNAHVQEQLIADILDISRIVTGKLRVQLRPIQLEPIVDASMDTLRPAASAKGVHLTADVEDAGTVLGDPDRLQQVVWNLLANAIKFTPAGGRVSLSLASKGSTAQITVTDTGEGITPELLPYVFDRFTQGDASVTRQHGGLGLGLSIVKHIVELHGGQVHATSEGCGRGATFFVLLPIRAIHAASTAVSRSPHPLVGLRVLVVDDDADARQVVSMALTCCGARTEAAGSAREALQMMDDFRPDVLVSDISMPGEDGYSLIRRVRAMAAHGLGNVPAVALTGLADNGERDRALMAGFQQFVPKPVEADALAEVVRSVAQSRG